MLETIQKHLGYTFKDSSLLQESLTHPSLKGKATEETIVVHYERLEFLGDAVLGLVIAENLIRRYPDENEGGLAKRHSALVCGATLARIAQGLDVGNFIVMTHGERISGGESNKANLEDALEAIIGAIYLDGGLEPAKTFIEFHWQPLMDVMIAPPRDPKTALQEWAQKRGKPIPQYVMIHQEGPAHAPDFTVEVRVEGMKSVRANGSSKRLAERDAAAALLGMIEHVDTQH
ncbi:MAG: ribonuclease III [Alphaproteobacteria bacterium]|nr:ribonuclease III [Alphaproteobacteria bacterium]